MKKIKIDIFNYEINIYTGEKGLKEFKEITGTKEEDNEALGMVVKDCVWFKETEPCLNIIIHESHHLKYELCDSRGIDDEEAEAYITAYIATELMKKLLKKGDK